MNPETPQRRSSESRPVHGGEEVNHSFDVAFSTHDALKSGIVELGWHRVVVDAPDRDDAALAACQMVACTSGMPTKLLDRI